MRIALHHARSFVALLLIGLAGCPPETAAPQPPPAPASRPQPSRSAAEPIEPLTATTGPFAEEEHDRPEAAVGNEKPRASFRPPDTRARHDAAQVAEFGIREYRSRRLILYSDIEPEAAAPLPPLIDRAVDAWEAYFGPLPPARDGSDFQLTGYVMRDGDRFRRAGLLPVTLPSFAHGKHDAQQFWMNDSEYDYYRRHLLIHEATHCFMQAMGGTTRDVPVWYLEGMAELFATHVLPEDGAAQFRVFPERKEAFAGFGRIPTIQRAVAEGRLLTIDDIGRLQPQDFAEHNEAYAWAWGLCAWLDAHPRYGGLIRQLSREYVEDGFQEANVRLFAPVVADLAAEWQLFARHVCYGFDVERVAIDFVPGTPIAADGGVHHTTVAADRGWQSSGLAVVGGESYHITAAGRTALAQIPRPWESEPQGISIRYAEGRPIGRLVGVIISEPDAGTSRRQVGEVIDLGRETTFTAPIDGTLYLRVNDFWNELADNTGNYEVTARVSAGGN